jgi:prepilin-type N-terminal cleavage/methylation domain-containing protein
MLKSFPAGRPAFLKPGFTLMEILVSVAVLAIGCLAAISMQTKTMSGGAQAYDLTVASFLAESEIERLKSLARGRAKDPYDDAGSNPARLTPKGWPCDDDNTGPCYIRETEFHDGTPTSMNLWVRVRVWPEKHPSKVLTHDALIFFLEF